MHARSCVRKPDIGEKIWSRFSQPKEQTLWYYRSLADTFYERLPGQLSNELREIVEVLEGSPLASASGLSTNSGAKRRQHDGA